MENYTSALRCKKTDFDKLYCVRNPIACYKLNINVAQRKKIVKKTIK